MRRHRLSASASGKLNAALGVGKFRPDGIVRPPPARPPSPPVRLRRHRGVQGGRTRAPPARRRRRGAGRDDRECAAFVGAQTSRRCPGAPCAHRCGTRRPKRRWAISNSRAGPTRSLIAPATANTLARLAHGLADDLVSTLCLATTAPIAIAPAMNHRMWPHRGDAGQHRDAARARRAASSDRTTVRQACGEFGPGRMREPRGDRRRTAPAGALTVSLAGVRVVVSAGPDLRGHRPGALHRQPQQRQDGFRDRRRRRAPRRGRRARRRPGVAGDARRRAAHRRALGRADARGGARARCRPTSTSAPPPSPTSRPRRRRAAEDQETPGSETCVLELVRTPDILADVAAHIRARAWWSASPPRRRPGALCARQAARQAGRPDRGQSGRRAGQRLRERRQHADGIRGRTASKHSARAPKARAGRRAAGPDRGTPGRAAATPSTGIARDMTQTLEVRDARSALRRAVAVARLRDRRQCRRSTCARRSMRRWCSRRATRALMPSGLAIHIADPGAVRTGAAALGAGPQTRHRARQRHRADRRRLPGAVADQRLEPRPARPSPSSRAIASRSWCSCPSCVRRCKWWILSRHSARGRADSATPACADRGLP